MTDSRRAVLRKTTWPGLLLPLALILFFIAERVIGEGHEQLVFWRVAALLVFGAACGFRGWQWQRMEGQAKRVEQLLAIAYGGVLLSVVLYAFTTDAGLSLLNLEGDEARDRVLGALGGLWPGVLLCSLLALFFMELAYLVMPILEAVELRRVQAAGAAGLSLGLATVALGSASFVATQWNKRYDLAYFRTASPSETTVRMVRALDEPVEVVLFYQPVSDVLQAMQPYFAAISEKSERLTVRTVDHALAAELARRHQVRQNGTVLLTRGEGDSQQAESLEIGTDMDVARSRLRTLDGRFQEKFARLTSRPRNLHLTAGHRERSSRGAPGDAVGQRLSKLSDALRRGNIEVRELGVAQGLTNRVPPNTRAVAIMGPRDPFLPEEAQSLVRYLGEGGRVLVMIDPDVDHGLTPLLHALGVKMPPGVLNSERYIVARTRSLADRHIIYSRDFNTHPTVTIANRARGQVGVIFDRAGGLERYEGEGQLEGINVQFPIRTAEGFWYDLDDDHEQDEATESSQSRVHLMAAVTIPNGEDAESEGRAVIIADGDFATDAWIANPGNAFVLMDSLQWLVGQEQIVGVETTEEDVRIQHTREEDKLWFYGTSFGVPIPIFALGIWIAWRRRHKLTRREKTPKAEAEAGPKGTTGDADAGEPVAEEGEEEESA